jgi:hypothetical protein
MAASEQARCRPWSLDLIPLECEIDLLRSRLHGELRRLERGEGGDQ